MTPQVQIWMPTILALFGSLLAVVFTAWLNTKALSSQIEALRAETRQVLPNCVSISIPRFRS